jgi:hypothetical protein
MSKFFQKFFLVYFALRDPLILINEYILLCILSVAESTEPSIYTTVTTFWNLPEVVARNFYSREFCAIRNSVNYACFATVDRYKIRVSLKLTKISLLLK